MSRQKSSKAPGDPQSGSLFDALFDEAHPIFRYTFNSVGEYDYFCIPHEFVGMVGLVRVGVPTSVETPAQSTRLAYLHPANPNPFNPRTTIEFDLMREALVSLRVYDIAGRLVRALEDETVMEAGTFTTEWNGRDDLGREVSSGVYLYRLDTGVSSQTRRMVLLK